MISAKDREFLYREMKIQVESIDLKFREFDLLPFREEFESAISFFIKCISAQNRSGFQSSCNSCEDSPAEKEINDYSFKLSEILAVDEAISVLDSLRHAFCSFAYNGLHQLFTRQENEVWYPKIVLDEELKPNDIGDLPSIIILYRGTDNDEFNSAIYGQSWTTCKDIALAFAFSHYVGQSWYKNSERLVLKARISKRHVFFSDQSCEFEVVVDVTKLEHVRKIA